MKFILLICGVVTVSCTNSSDLYDVSKGPLVTNLVWFDITIGGVGVGRIVFGLFGRTVPMTVRNFVHLATPGRYNSHVFGYISSVTKGVELGGGNAACDSDYGDYFPKENFKLQHYGAGWVAATPYGPKTSNSCLFYICLKPLPQVDGKNVVFAKIIEGMKVLRKIENVSVKKNSPTIEIRIKNAGTELADPPFRVARTAVVE